MNAQHTPRTSVGQRVEDLKLYGFKDGEALTAEERSEIVEFAVHFEECNNSQAELEALSDADLVSASYWAMVDYARGQM